MLDISIAIIVNNSKVLLVKRNMPENKLQWQFPAGKVKNGEETNITAERETFEETGIKCKAIELLGVRTHPDTNVKSYYWLCDYISGVGFVKDRIELSQIEWCDKNYFFKLVTSDIFKPVENFINDL